MNGAVRVRPLLWVKRRVEANGCFRSANVSHKAKKIREAKPATRRPITTGEVDGVYCT
jgi:hypothetical protein